eukprot:GHVP01062030.1.p2 GENE.GHVP01062030.1~~GHVP01062030.1.p2  ORF type:complete len:110 (+),score=37.24 GHVP01062030.1:17-346(+)
MGTKIDSSFSDACFLCDWQATLENRLIDLPEKDPESLGKSDCHIRMLRTSYKSKLTEVKELEHKKRIEDSEENEESKSQEENPEKSPKKKKKTEKSPKSDKKKTDDDKE